MTGSNAAALTPLSVGVSDSGDFSSWLGRPVQSNEETYVVCQASVAITGGQGGKQLATAISSGQGSFVVVLATGGATNYAVCGAIPWSHTDTIAAGAYFLAVRDSSQHVMRLIGSATGAMEAGGLLTVSTGALLTNILTGNAAPLTGQAATASGLGVIFDGFKSQCGMCLTADTGVASVSGWVRYRAPFRGAD